jgi:hypothetical protein
MPDERARSRPGEPAEPWRSFLRELDAALTGTVELRCLGGFVVAQHYGVGRETSDIDFLAALIESQDDDLERLAGLDSALYRKFRLYLQRVGVVTPPCDYESRLVRMFPSAPWQRLKLLALDATDLALSKVERNWERDREDFLRLVRAGLVDLEVFKTRYFEELRPYLLAKHEWHDRTVELWLAIASTPDTRR